jgi:hypothetical protein
MIIVDITAYIPHLPPTRNNTFTNKFHIYNI